MNIYEVRIEPRSEELSNTFLCFKARTDAEAKTRVANICMKLLPNEMYQVKLIKKVRCDR